MLYDKILEVDKGTLDQKITAAKAAFTASKKALDVAQKTLNGTLSEELQAARASLKLAQQDLDIAPDSGTVQSIILPSETLTFSGGSNIGTSATSNTVMDPCPFFS